MNEAILCPNCHFPYDASDRMPLVLRCGHSLCMVCALATLSTSERRLCCLKCPFLMPASMAAIKDLPVNRTLLEAFGVRSEDQVPQMQDLSLGESPFRKSPMKFQSLRSMDQFFMSTSRVLFRDGNDYRYPEDDKRFSYPTSQLPPLFTPPPAESAFDAPLTSPTTVAMKCKRSTCSNDRYYYNGQVFDYCSIKCEEQDRIAYRF